MKRMNMKKTGCPPGLSVKGKAQTMLLNAGTQQQVGDFLDAVAGIREGLDQMKKGKGRPVNRVFDDLNRKGTC